MMRCMNSAIAGLKAHQTAMDVIGNNIANVDTSGFKSGSISFRDAMYQETQAASAGQAGTGIAGSNPVQIGYGSTASSIYDNMTKGGISDTGDAKDIYINGDGYLVVANGGITNGTDGTGILPTATYEQQNSGAVEYTRVGHLDFDSNGFLTDGYGHYILGRQYGLPDADGNQTPVPADLANGTSTYDATTAPLVPIKYNPKAGKLESVKIGSEGTITADYNGKNIKIGQIALANFANAAGLEKTGDSYYKASENSGEASYSNPGSNATGKLQSGALEASNTDLATEFSNMIMYERAYQANTKIISVADEMYQTLVNMK